jgi:hypothetical protein
MGQFIYILIAMVLLMNLVVSVTRVDIATSSDMVTNQIRNDAISLAQSMIEEVWTKTFDEKLVTGTSQTVWTAVNKLGPETGESYSTWDDIDDYNGYTKDTTWGASPFTVSVTVSYANPKIANFTTAGITYYKIVRVSVVSKMNTKVRKRSEKVRINMYQIMSRLSDD